jgi:hypothetical protein
MIRVIGPKPPPVVMTTEELSPEELVEWRRRREIFERNQQWYSVHVDELYETYAGKFICVAGGEVFAGDDARDVYARSAAVHPDESGVEYGMYIRAKSQEHRV